MGKFLIELTDERLKNDDNRDVMEFIRVVNPFAHSDLGIKLMELGKGIEGATWYCPAPGPMAYAVLHTEKHRIFAIAYDMHDLVFRLPPTSIPAALGDGGQVAGNIGSDWVRFDAWPASVPRVVTQARLAHWCEVACRAATS